MSNIYEWSLGEVPTFTGTLEREVEDDVWVEEDLGSADVVSVTVTLYKMDGKTYKSNAAVTKMGGGRVKYIGAVADTQQGELTGKFLVTYADGSKVAFPKPGRFSVRVSQ